MGTGAGRNTRMSSRTKTIRIADPRQGQRRGVNRNRRGVSSMLAMLYLVLFSTLAVGFYAAVNTSVQVAANETKAKRALLAAESGMAFVRHVLANVQIPHGTTVDNMWPELVRQVKAQLDGKPVVNGKTLHDQNGTLVLRDCRIDQLGSMFTATLIRDADQVQVQVTGLAKDLELKRTIQISYAKARRASQIFDYGIASKSAVLLGGRAEIRGGTDPTRGSVLSTTESSVPMEMTGGASISGDFAWTNASGNPSFGSNTSVARLKPGATVVENGEVVDRFEDHVHKPSEVIPPEFPIIDTSIFEKYVPSATAPPGPQVIATKPSSSRLSYTNVRIKAGVGTASSPLEFGAGTVFNGVVYIETPNHIKFSGGVSITGVIVSQNNPTGDITTNSIYFGGNVLHQGVEKLPETFGDLRKLTGSFVLAPNFTITMRGNSNSAGGTMVTGALDISGAAGANIKGNVINMQDKGSSVKLNGNAEIVITAAGTGDYPAGVYFGTHYVPLPDSYKEIAQ